MEGGDICGFSFDHDEDVVYEDEEVTQIVCRRCGAEMEVRHD